MSLRGCSALVLASLLLAPQVRAQYAEIPRPLPNAAQSSFGFKLAEPIRTATQIGRRLFIGGRFTDLGATTGGAAVLDALGVLQPQAFPVFGGGVSQTGGRRRGRVVCGRHLHECGRTRGRRFRARRAGSHGGRTIPGRRRRRGSAPGRGARPGVSRRRFHDGERRCAPRAGGSRCRHWRTEWLGRDLRSARAQLHGAGRLFDRRLRCGQARPLPHRRSALGPRGLERTTDVRHDDGLGRCPRRVVRACLRGRRRVPATGMGGRSPDRRGHRLATRHAVPLPVGHLR